MKGDVVQNSIGQLCPMPILMLAKNMKKLQPGQVLEIHADDEGAQADVPAWCAQTGNELLGTEDGGGFTKYFVKKAG